MPVSQRVNIPSCDSIIMSQKTHLRTFSEKLDKDNPKKCLKDFLKEYANICFPDIDDAIFIYKSKISDLKEEQERGDFEDSEEEYDFYVINKIDKIIDELEDEINIDSIFIKRWKIQMEKQEVDREKERKEDKKKEREEKKEKIDMYLEQEQITLVEISDWEQHIKNRLQEEWNEGYTMEKFENDMKRYRDGLLKFRSYNHMKMFVYQRFVKFIRIVKNKGKTLVAYKMRKEVIIQSLRCFREDQKKFIVKIIDPEKEKKIQYAVYDLLEQTNLFNARLLDWIPYHPMKKDKLKLESDILNTYPGHHFSKKIKEWLNTHKDLSLDEEEMKEVQIFRDYCQDILTGGDEKGYRILENLQASLIQNPTTLLPFVIFFSKSKGTGKTTLFENYFVKHVVGDYCHINGLEEAVDKFNSHMKESIVVIVRELKEGCEKTLDVMNKMKGGITDATWNIEGKGLDKIKNVRNVRHWFGYTNYENCIILNDGADRRYIVLVGSEKSISNGERDANYFIELNRWLQD